MSADAPILADVWLLGLPVALHAQAEERHEELLREFSHIANADDRAQIPQRLLGIVAEVRAMYAPFTGPARQQILEARADGEEAIDLRYRVPPEGRAVATTFLHVLEEADEFCRSGDLLTLAAPPELVRLRRWLFGEFERQLDGAPPLPWPGHAGGAA